MKKFTVTKTFSAAAITIALCGLVAAPVFAVEKKSEVGDFVWLHKPNSNLVRIFKIYANHENVAFSPDGKYALIKQDGDMKLWDIATGENIRSFDSNSSLETSAFSPDGRYVLAGYDDNTIRLWNVATGECLRTFKTSKRLHRVRFSPDGKYAISGSSDDYGTIHIEIWDISIGKCVRTVEMPARHSPFIFSPDGKEVLSGGGYGNTFKLWNIATGKCVRTLKGPYWDIITFSQDGRYFLTSQQNNMEVWDIDKGKKVQNFIQTLEQGHTDDDKDVRSAVFSPDGRYVLAGYGDNTIRLWSVATGECLRTFMEYSDPSVDEYVAFSPDGKYALSCSQLGFKLWYMGIGVSFSTALSDIMSIENPMPELPAKLEQGKYESKSAFEARIAKTKTDYETAVETYNANLSAGPTIKTLSQAFGIYYGSPNITFTSYDTDTGIFTFKVKSDELLFRKEKHEYTFALKEPILNEKAEAFDVALKSARPQIYFHYEQGTISLSSAVVKIDEQEYAAVPSAAAAQTERLIVDLGGLGGAPLANAGDIEIAMAQKSEDPELSAKAQELARLKKEKDNAERKAKFEAQLAQLKSEGVRSYVSDVDTAAFQKPEHPDDYALIVGIESYNNNLPKADYAERDADAVKAHLLALGVPERNIKLLKGNNATNATLKNYLESWLPKNVTENSRVYCYFSGHGSPDTKTGSAYILPWDGAPEFLETSAYPLEQVYASLGALKAKAVLVALDSCFSGAGGHSILPRGVRPLVLTKQVGLLPANITVFVAAQGNEITGGLDEQGHGIFTYYFLKGLNSGIIDSGSLCEYLTPKVKDTAARQNRSQTPACYGPQFKW